ncbi:hypothetical protein FRN05_05480 [Salmonella enterica subsp. enterica]|nr:hypothetical protein [Salmonella enterica subsp. enterica serovar Meleagridis]EDW6361861.1 hypothetical protein [Salmonella enterica subsp. enterica]EGK3371346.1 hypothetical protein [Salmonella enterica]
MKELEDSPLHQSQFAAICLECPPALTESIEDHFRNNGFEAGRTACFSADSPDKLSIVFELATQACKLAGAIMGLLNRNDLEIELNLGTRDDEPKIAKVKLRRLKDAEACERLINKLASIVVTEKQGNQ